MSTKQRKTQTTEENSNGHEDTGGTTITIEKGVEIPAYRARGIKYPFEQMQPGDSFVIPKKTGAASVTVSYWKKKLPGREFTVRQIGEDSSRVWRIDGLKTDENIRGLKLEKVGK